MAADEDFVLVNDIELVSKCELDGLRKCKLMLEETKTALDKKEKKFKHLATVLANCNIRTKRTRIALELSNFENLSTKEEFYVYSNPVDLVGFQWILSAQRSKTVENGAWLSLFLRLAPPQHYTGPFEFDVLRTFRLLNVSPAKDIAKEGNKKFKHDSLPYNWGFAEFIEIKELLERKNGFLQPDGSVLVEVDFTVESATTDHLLVDAKQDVEENKKDGN